MSIEKKSLISNRAATKKANLTKVNAATQVSATKMAQPKVQGKVLVSPAASSKLNSKLLVSPAATSKLGGRVLVSPAASSKLCKPMISMKVRAL